MFSRKETKKLSRHNESCRLLAAHLKQKWSNLNQKQSKENEFPEKISSRNKSSFQQKQPNDIKILRFK